MCEPSLKRVQLLLQHMYYQDKFFDLTTNIPKIIDSKSSFNLLFLILQYDIHWDIVEYIFQLYPQMIYQRDIWGNTILRYLLQIGQRFPKDFKMNILSNREDESQEQEILESYSIYSYQRGFYQLMNNDSDEVYVSENELVFIALVDQEEGDNPTVKLELPIGARDISSCPAALLCNIFSLLLNHSEFGKE